MKKIALAGACGRMGSAITALLPNFKELKLVAALDVVGHVKIGGRVAENSDVRFSSDVAGALKISDVLVDFTGAEAAMVNLKFALSAGKPIVIGATGLSQEARTEIFAASKKIPVVYSPNMSVGVNVLWKLVAEAAALLGKDYHVDVVETHHVHKKDAPSGTAKKIMELVAENGGYNLNKDVFFYLENEDARGAHSTKMPESRDGKMVVRSIREGEVVGDHSIIFTSPFERLELSHRAFTREVFANGALKAASWVCGKEAGLYEMSDVIGIK